SFLNRWYGRRPGDKIDRYTSIGRIGRLKQSGTIVMRLDSEGTAPPLIRESSYQMFTRKNYWAANRANYTNVIVEPDSTTWRLLKNKPASRGVRISQYLEGGRGFL